MDEPCAVKLNRRDVDLDQLCVFDYGILGRNMQHMQLKKVVKQSRNKPAVWHSELG